MDSIREIRRSLGISQWQLAQWLGTNRSVLSMAELGQRSLPTPAYVKLNQLLECIRQLAQQPHTMNRHPKLVKQRTDMKRHLSKLASRQHFKAIQLQRRMDKLQEQKKRPVFLLGLLNHLRNDPGYEIGASEKIMLDMLEADAMARIQQKKEKNIALLEWQIANLQSAVANAKRLAEAMDTE